MDAENINNKLHVRLFVAQLLADKVGDDRFRELADKLMDFIMEDIDIPPCPPPSFIDVIGRIDSIAPFNIDKEEKEEDKDSLEYKFKHHYKELIVKHPKNLSMIGRIHGYSTEFDALIAGCETDGTPGLPPSDSDILECYHPGFSNGIFYIKAEEVEKQIEIERRIRVEKNKMTW